MWGPPVGGIAYIDAVVISFAIDFGIPLPKEPELVATWQQFCHNFLNLSGGDRRAVSAPVNAFPIIQANLAAGRNNLNTLPNARRKDAAPKRDDAVWKVRADQLELSAATVVPVTTLNVGRVNTAGATDGIQTLDFSGQSMMVTKALALDASETRAQKSATRSALIRWARSSNQRSTQPLFVMTSRSSTRTKRLDHRSGDRLRPGSNLETREAGTDAVRTERGTKSKAASPASSGSNRPRGNSANAPRRRSSSGIRSKPARSPNPKRRRNRRLPLARATSSPRWPRNKRNRKRFSPRSKRKGSRFHGNRRRRFASVNCRPILSPVVSQFEIKDTAVE